MKQLLWALVLVSTISYGKDVVTVTNPLDSSQSITFTDEDCPVNVGTEAGIFYGNKDRRQSGCYSIDDNEVQVTFFDIRNPQNIKQRVLLVKDINAATKRHNDKAAAQDMTILEMYRNGQIQQPPKPLTCNLMNNYMACY